jgi:hypothetical protein
LVDVQQTKHILGPAAYAAFALELDQAGDPNVSDSFVRWAIEHVTTEVREILQHMPARQAGKSRVDRLLFDLDTGIHSKRFSQDTVR